MIDQSLLPNAGPPQYHSSDENKGQYNSYWNAEVAQKIGLHKPFDFNSHADAMSAIDKQIAWVDSQGRPINVADLDLQGASPYGADIYAPPPPPGSIVSDAELAAQAKEASEYGNLARAKRLEDIRRNIYLAGLSFRASRSLFGEKINAATAPIPIPGGVYLPLTILILLWLILIPTNGHTRLRWLWLVITNNASLSQSQETGLTIGPPAPDTSPVAVTTNVVVSSAKVSYADLLFSSSGV